MKKILLTMLALLFLTLNLEAQQRPPEFKNNEKIRALKTAFITQELDLTSKEAEKFWPIYNKYVKNTLALRVRRMLNLKNSVEKSGGIDALSDKESDKILNDFLAIEKDNFEAKVLLSKELQKVISTQKILKLYKAEENFNRRMMQRLQNRRGSNQRPGKRN